MQREDDKITKWIRDYYSPHVDHDLFEYNILLSRFLNWPDTLEKIGYQYEHLPAPLEHKLTVLSSQGKIWGNAYVITTHGIKMPKLAYLCRNVLPNAWGVFDGYRSANRLHTCRGTAERLQEIEGVGNFLAGQIVADLKNTVGHPLYTVRDKDTFVVPGPGSIRGASWFHYGKPDGVTAASFERYFDAIRNYAVAHWPAEVPMIDNQDLQNCLCEFDKYMRVRNGTGRSKRRYNGH